MSKQGRGVNKVFSGNIYKYLNEFMFISLQQTVKHCQKPIQVE